MGDGWGREGRRRGLCSGRAETYAINDPIYPIKSPTIFVGSAWSAETMLVIAASMEASDARSSA